MYKISTSLFFVIYLFLFPLHAQQLTDADVWFDAQDYCKAKPLYAGALKNKPYDANLNYKYAQCLYNIGEYPQAIKHLELAARKIPQANICLGDIFYNNYHFTEAQSFYSQALSQLQSADAAYALCLLKLEKITKTQQMLSSVEDLLIMDSLVVDKKTFFTHYDLSKDAGKLFAAIDVDSATRVPYTGFLPERADRMFYVDTLMGKSDIFQTNKLLDGWSEKQSVSVNVNTAANENFPFLMSDGITLYYASDSPASMGGYDIFVTRFRSDTNDYLSPENVGMPFNSPYNDYLLVFDEEKKQGWFASDRYQTYGKVIIYKFKTRDQRKEIQTEDVEERIRFAQLKQYNLFMLSHDSSSVSILDSVPLLKTPSVQLEQMNFVVNDTLVYRSPSDFVSQEALAMYLKGAQLDEKIKYIKSLLVQKRQEYSMAENSDQKQLLLPELLGLEQELNKLISEPNVYLKDARNLEIKALGDRVLVPLKSEF